MTNKELMQLAHEIDNLVFQLDYEICQMTKKLEKLSESSGKLCDETITRDLEEARNE